MPDAESLPEDVQVLSVGEISDRIERVLKAADDLQDVWVRGEASNIHRSKAGHLYFSLKDDDGSIRVAVFRYESRGVPEFDDGAELLVRGDVDIYSDRSEYQIVGQEVRPAGMGELYERFLELKAQLESEGLFDPERKRPIPSLPRTVGIVTSGRGAAIQDIIDVARRRYPNIDLLVTPTLVQGPGAAAGIVEAIEKQNRHGVADLLIVGRGGGSIEDLWAFNEEPVARAIAGSRIPVVSAVGHETDTTIADLVADRRAPTPSAAAEIAVPRKAELLERVRTARRALAQDLQRLARARRDTFDAVLRRSVFQFPRRMIEDRAQRADDLARRLSDGLRHLWARDRELFARAEGRLSSLRPRAAIDEARRALDQTVADLRRGYDDAVADRDRGLRTLTTKLDSLSPMNVLERGYTVVRRPDATPVTRAAQTAGGETLDVRFADGTARTTVEDVTHE